MKTKRLCVVTMIGGFDLIGDLVTNEGDDQTMLKLERPYTVRVEPMQGQPVKVILRDMVQGITVIQGDSIVLNMRSVLWIAEPTKDLSSAYQAQRSGLLMPEQAINDIRIHAVQ